MKIGILTYHRSQNYGAQLQAIALRYVLCKMGHETYFVDYYPEYHQWLYKPFSLQQLNTMAGITGKAAYFLYYPLRRWRYANIQRFNEREIVPYCRPVDEDYDVIVYGSDQIWRKQVFTHVFNPVYFGAWTGNGPAPKRVGRHVSYAASMGVMKLSDSDKATLKELVGHLDAVSVREESLKELLVSLGVKNVQISLDPTLLLTAEGWNELLPPCFSSKESRNLGGLRDSNSKTPTSGKGYVVMYDLLQGSFDMGAVKAFAQRRGLELVRLEGFACRIPTSHHRTTDGPEEFVNLIRNADFVFTSSYHGLVFSLLYGKQFVAAFKENAGRAGALLSLTGLENRMIKAGAAQIPDMPDIDYSSVAGRLAPVREESLAYLAYQCITSPAQQPMSM